MGMVNRAVPHDELMDEVWAEVAAIRKAPGVLVSVTKALLNDVMERQGFRPRGRVSELLSTLTVLSEPATEFYRRRDEDGMDDAIEWMQSADKP